MSYSTSLVSSSSHSESLALWSTLGLPDLSDLHERSQVILDCEHSVVEHSLVVLVDGTLSVLGLLVGDRRRAKELAELVPVELAL